MKRCAQIALMALCIGVAAVDASAADGSTTSATSLFTAPPQDWAAAWLKFIFKGVMLPEELGGKSEQLAQISKAMRSALHIYSMGMLFVAGFLVLYHVLAMVAETAHTGVAFGLRVNQLWTPIRFLLAILLIVPVSGGLSGGQYLIVMLAEQGSNIASTAWRAVSNGMKDGFSDFVTPRSPDVDRIAAAAIEMELCSTFYRTLYASVPIDETLAVTGQMPVAPLKLAPGKITPEIWRYTNVLNPDSPLCGEFRFSADPSQRGLKPVNLLRNKLASTADDLAAFSRITAERLILNGQNIAGSLALRFLPPAAQNNTNGQNGANGQNQGAGQTSSPPLPQNIGSLDAAFAEGGQLLQAALQAKLKELGSQNGNDMEQLLQDSGSSGWARGGSFLLDIAQKQALSGALSDGAIPEAQSPIFGHTETLKQLLKQAIENNPVLEKMTPLQLEKINTLYDKTDAAMKKARAWIYSKGLSEGGLILPDTYDMEDVLSKNGDAKAGFMMFGHIMDAATRTYGIWASGEKQQLIGVRSSLAGLENSFLSLSEFGRRYDSFGKYLIGIGGMSSTSKAVLGPSILFLALGSLFVFAGMTLALLLPLLVFIRFFAAFLVWLLSVVEAVVALPLVAIAHINPVGEGLSGPTARQAYWLWLGVFLRPLLTIFGFVAGLLLFACAMAFINAVIMQLMNTIGAAQSGLLSHARVSLALVYAVCAWIAVNVAFKGVTQLPEKALNWLNDQLMPDVSSIFNATMKGQAAAVAGSLQGREGAGGQLTAGGGALQAGAATVYARTNISQDEIGTASVAGARVGSQLFPAYAEKPIEGALSGQMGGAMAFSASLSASGGDAQSSGAAASATVLGVNATAIATAIAKQMPNKESSLDKSVLRAADALALMAEEHKEAQKLTNKSISARPATKAQSENKAKLESGGRSNPEAGPSRPQMAEPLEGKFTSAIDFSDEDEKMIDAQSEAGAQLTGKKVPAKKTEPPDKT